MKKRRSIISVARRHAPFVAMVILALLAVFALVWVTAGARAKHDRVVATQRLMVRLAHMAGIADSGATLADDRVDAAAHARQLLRVENDPVVRAELERIISTVEDPDGPPLDPAELADQIQTIEAAHSRWHAAIVLRIWVAGLAALTVLLVAAVLGPWYGARRRQVATTERVSRGYRRIFEALGGVLYTRNDRTGQFNFLAGDVEALTGYRPSELTPKLFTSRVRRKTIYGPLGALTYEERKLREVQDEEYRIKSDYLFERADGRFIWITDAATSQADESGEVYGALGILLDITERKRDEERANAFAALGGGLAAVRSVSEAAANIADLADRLIGWDCCFIAVVDPDAKSGSIVYMADEVEGRRQVLTGPPVDLFPSELTRYVLENGPQHFPTRADVPNVPTHRFGDTSRQSQSVLIAPLSIDGRPVGVASFQRYQPNAYTRADFHDLISLADYCAAGFHRAMLSEQVRINEEQFREVWESAGSGMRLTDANGIIRNVNPAFCRLVDMKREQLVGQPITAYYAPEVREPILKRYRERFAAGSVPPVLERSIRLASGREVTFQISNSIVHTSEGLMLLGVFRDLTKEKQLEAELKAFAGQMEQLAAVDMLTGLANRRSLLSQLGTEFRRARRYGLPMSIVLLDLDNFKSVNDKHGHLTGDAALSRVGGILRSFARAVDVAGRYGGEEFLLVMPHTNLAGAVAVADRIRQSIEAAVIHDADGRAVHISCSVGTVEMDAEVKTEQELIARADRALYKAKDAGRNRVETV